VSAKRQKKKKPSVKEVAEVQRTALVTSALAVVLLIGTGAYFVWCAATGRHAHIYLWVVVVNLFALLLAWYFVWEWRRTKRLRG